MMALGVIGFQIMATHQVAHAVDRGFEPAAVVWFFSFGGLSMVAGNVLGDWLSDRLGSGWVFALGTLVAIAGIGCFALLRGTQDLPLLLLYTAAGFRFGMRIALLSTIPAAVFSGPHLGTILGVVQAGGGLGGAIGPFLGGWLFDVSGSYEWAFVAASRSWARAWRLGSPRGQSHGCAQSLRRRRPVHLLALVHTAPFGANGVTERDFALMLNVWRSWLLHQQMLRRRGGEAGPDQVPLGAPSQYRTID
jgi:MFS family permease